MHEPKGVASATANQIYRADGAGSGSWQTLTIPTGLFRVAITSFTSAGTWTKPANLFKIRVHVVGEGGTSTLAGGSTAFGGHAGATGGAANGGAVGQGTVGDLLLAGQLGLAATTEETGFGGQAAGPWFPKGRGTNAAKTSGASGGSGGGYAVKEVLAASLSSTVVVGMTATGAANGFCVVEEYIST